MMVKREATDLCIYESNWCTLCGRCCEEVVREEDEARDILSEDRGGF